MPLSFVVYGLIARHVSKADFGHFSLAFGLSNVLATLSCLGLDNSLPGFIAQRRESGETGKVWSGMRAALWLTLLAGLAALASVQLFGGAVARLAGRSEYVGSVRILSLAVPLIAVSTLMVTFLQSVQNVRGKLINDLFSSVLRLGLIALVVLLQLRYAWVLWAHVASFLLVALVLTAYARGRLAPAFPDKRRVAVTRELLAHSFPVLLSNFWALCVLWADILILGLFAPAEEVGIYSAGTRLTRLLPFLFNATGFIYLPIAAQLYFQNRTGELKTLHAFTNKWIVLVTFPIFLFFFCAPDTVMSTVFGPNYAEGNEFFRLLSLGFFLILVFGLNTTSLLAFGKNRHQLAVLVISSVTNVALDFLLIPRYGGLGASVASCVAIVIGGVLSTYFVNSFAGIHPFPRSSLRIYACLAAITAGLSLLVSKGALSTTGWQFFALVLLASPLTVLGTRSVSAEDLMLIRNLEMKLTQRARISDMISAGSGGETPRDGRD